MKKRLFSFLLALCLVGALLPFGAFADKTAGNLTYKVQDGEAIITGWRSVPEDGKIMVPDTLGGAPVKRIKDYALADCKDLTEAVLPEGLEEIGACAFQNSGLQEINVPAGLRSVGMHAFDYTPLLRNERFWEDDIFYFGTTALKVRGEGVSYTVRPGTTVIYFPLEHPEKLTSVTLPEGLLRIGNGVFQHAVNLKSITLPDSLQYIGDESFIRSGLTSVTIPPHVVAIGDSAFSECKLERITLTGNALETVGRFAFWNNPLRMDTLKLPNSVKSVGTYAFAGGIYKELILSESMTKLEPYSFSGSSWLETLRIPASITTIGEGALQGRLFVSVDSPQYTTKVFYGGTESQWKQVRIRSHNSPLDTMAVSCSAEPCVDPFVDVPVSKYYADPVAWAVSHEPQITNGTSGTTFEPEKTCTRGQVVTFLWRAAGEPEPTGKKNPFRDISKDAYYYKAVLWAVEQKITNGTSDKTFSPNDPCTRAHVVTFLYRSEGSPALEGTTNPFTDVPDGRYYTDAVLWAVNHDPQITNGTSNTTFSPASDCTRGQIVTFLYRDMA